jgi:hypothetical protein
MLRLGLTSVKAKPKKGGENLKKPEIAGKGGKMPTKAIHRGLTENEVKFIEAFQGDVRQAAELAGIHFGTAHRMLRRAHVTKALRARSKATINDLIAGKEERMIFFSELLRDQSAAAKDRLKAGELLCKMGGDFIIQIQQDTRLEIQVQGFDELIQCRSADPVGGPVIDISQGAYQAPGCEGGAVAGLLCGPDVGDDGHDSAPAPSKKGRPRGSKAKKKSESNQPVGESASVL